jgi:hypothetical protein
LISIGNGIYFFFVVLPICYEQNAEKALSLFDASLNTKIDKPLMEQETFLKG